VIVGTYVSGVIQDVLCDYNTKVTKGQLCAKIDPRPYQTIVDQDRAQLAVAKAQLEKDKAALAYAKASLDRNADLVRRDVVSKDTFDQVKATFDQAQAQIQLDEATIGQRQAELSAAEVNLGYTEIISPVDGTVVSRNVTRGQTVAASFQTPTLFLIAADLTEMEVDTNVSESDIGGVTEGNHASFTVESFQDTTFEGIVTQVRQAPQTIQNVVTYDVVIAVKNPDLKLKPGMTATAKIVLDRRDNVMRVPSQALRYSPGGAAGSRGRKTTEMKSIWLLREGTPVRVDVETGLDDDSYAELRKGDVKEGDIVILSEQQAPTSKATARPHF
jgi:HlyD family secretion protein